MGFLSNQLQSAFEAGTAHKNIAAQLFQYCRENKDSIGSNGYWYPFFNLPGVDSDELAKSLKYLPKKNGDYCVELSDVNFYFRTDKDSGLTTIQVLKEITGEGMSSFSNDNDYESEDDIDEYDEAEKEKIRALFHGEDQKTKQPVKQARQDNIQRAKDKEAEIDGMPMPEETEVVLKLKECLVFAGRAKKTEGGKAGEIIKEAWLSRYNIIMDYAKTHYANSSEFKAYIAELEEKERQEQAELAAKQAKEAEEKRIENEKEQKRLKGQRIHRWVFWGIYLLAAIITFCSIEEWWEWVLSILAFIVAAVIRFFVHISFDD